MSYRFKKGDLVRVVEYSTFNPEIKKMANSIILNQVCRIVKKANEFYPSYSVVFLDDKIDKRYRAFLEQYKRMDTLFQSELCPLNGIEIMYEKAKMIGS